MAGEVWRDLPKDLLLSAFQASDSGHIRIKSIQGRVAEDIDPSTGYHTVNLRDDFGRLNTYYVHKLVILTFKPVPRGLIIRNKRLWCM